MRQRIASLLDLFADRVPDAERNARVRELANTRHRWSAGHAVFDGGRGRRLRALEENDRTRAG
jgi:hypothetical protein